MRAAWRHAPAHKEKATGYMYRSLVFPALEAVPLFEAVHTPAAVYQLLPARKKRMAFGADFHLQLFLDGTCFKRLATSAADYRRFILWMDAFLHDFHLVTPASNAGAIII